MTIRTSYLLVLASIMFLLLGTACTSPEKSGATGSGEVKPAATTVPAKKPDTIVNAAKSAVTTTDKKTETPTEKVDAPAEKADAPVEKTTTEETAPSVEKATVPVEKVNTLSKATSPTPAFQKVELVYGDIVMADTAEGMKEGEVEAVVFPHWFHRIRFRCKVCHEDTFMTDKGTNKIDMDAISAGESCGVCHDGSVAWDPLECESCHFYPLEQVEQDKLAKEKEPENQEDILFSGRSGKTAGRGDRRHPSGSAFKWGAGWQPRALALAGLPRDKYGLVDWVDITRKGTLLPKGSIDPEDPLYESPVHYEFDEEGEEDIEDILIPVKSKTLSAVVFPHTLHTWWLGCKSCHPKRFDRTAGDTVMTMKEMAKGKYCGECHGTVAFPLEDCEKCHNKQKVEACKASESCLFD